MEKERNWYMNYENTEAGYESSAYPLTTEETQLCKPQEQMPFAAK